MIGKTAGSTGLLAVAASVVVAAAVQPMPARASADAPKPARVPYAAVARILKARCYDCHGATSPSGGLALDSPAGLKRGGKHGPAYAPGRAAASLLIQRVTSKTASRMPMGLPPLPAKEIATLRAWIDQGASFAGASAKHWAYVPPAPAPVPAFGAGENPIDGFVARRLAAAKLDFSPPAPKDELLRRVCLDLTGLPPTDDQRRAFLADARPDAYERLVDRLLDAPQYGERMASPWLDLARYADSNGYEKDLNRSMWPYRDWVVRAFNSDMPYDRFVVEQVAGDMLPGAAAEDLVATGFNANTMLNQEGGVDEGEQRWLRLVDRVGVTASVFLGTTLKCAQCHDHKYDPFTQAEFYKFLAFFETSDEPTLKLYDPRLDDVAGELTQLKVSLASAGGNPDAVKALEQKVDLLQTELGATRGETTLILKERPNAYPPTTHIRIKGGYLSKGALVVAGTPAALNPMPAGVRNDRLGLAEWIASRNNPLTARVEVNRLWSMVFGVGLVKTEGDFGTQGERPLYQDLLDYLAVRFMDDGWSVKKLLRLVVTSRTYRQSSAASEAAVARDPQNRLLARGARFRMSAEMIRDDALAAGGILSLKQGGPSVMPDQPAGVWNQPYSDEKWVLSAGEDRYRRGLYTFIKRTSPYPAFIAFDATSREECTVNRIRTNTPLQALVLLNDPVYLAAARGVAEAMIREKSPAARIDRAYERLLCRAPTDAERARLLAFLSRETRRFETDPAEATRFLGPAGPLPGASPAESAATILAAHALLNTDEAITKE